ncbi:MAG: DUF4260 domain-containing protein [Methylobacter sp.]|jgi:hypothetical protein
MLGETRGVVHVVLRLEGLCVLVAASVAYSKFGLVWETFALFFLTPDISFLGYLSGPAVGAVSYNLAHSYSGAVACLVADLVLPAPTILGVGLIWCAHIGFDRALGYKLKYSDGFCFTHLGRIGRFSEITSNSAVSQETTQ